MKFDLPVSVYGNHTSTQTDPLETPKPSFWPSAMPGRFFASFRIFMKLSAKRNISVNDI